MNSIRLKARFPYASAAFIAKNSTNETPQARTLLPDPKPKPDASPTLEGTGTGKEKGVRRTLVRFIGYRVRPLDPDNFAGSVKDVLDGLRHAGLIPGDEPWKIRLATEQVRVGKFSEERTEIEIVR